MLSCYADVTTGLVCALGLISHAHTHLLDYLVIYSTLHLFFTSFHDLHAAIIMP
jgi:hypothetical protein